MQSSKEKYDVYVDDGPTPLKEGGRLSSELSLQHAKLDRNLPQNDAEKKHVISIFVADESGLINRVAGVFGRRGMEVNTSGLLMNYAFKCTHPIQVLILSR